MTTEGGDATLASPTTMTLAERLKHATHQQHESLHTVVDITAALESMKAYRDLLGRFYRAVSSLECGQAEYVLSGASPGLDLKWPPRMQKTRWLADDWKAINGRCQSGETDRGIVDPPELFEDEARRPLPVPDSPSTFAGRAYVLEGMTLGGQYIRRSIEKRWSIGGAGLRFFTGYGEQTGRCWNEFKSALNVADVQVSNTISAAQTAFDHFAKVYAGD